MAPDDDDARLAAKEAAKIRALLESAVDAIITIDRRGIIEAANPAAERLFQYDEAEFQGRNVSFLMPEPYRTEHDGYLARYLKTGQRRIIGIGREVTGQRKDGTTFPMHLSVSEFEADGATYFTGIIRDLTASKRAEEALRQSHKMDALGQLTGGVAHDFNNLLTVIIGNAELLEMRLQDARLREILAEAKEAAEVGARLTNRLLAFARRSPLAPKVLDLNAMVVSLTEMLHRTLGEQVGLSTALAPRLWPVRTDISEFESVIVNLAVNARDAMPGGGKLILETENLEVDALYAAVEDALTPGEYVRLSVSDTGTGMPPEVRARVFEPFFTTKEAGRGTGMGLSMVYGFVKQSGGHVTVYSEVGKGTTLNIYLPRYRGDETPAMPASKASGPAEATGETVLVVEDDTRVRRLALTQLQELGYRVLEAGSGAEAIAILEEGAPVDLVLSDLVMPGGMSGIDVCRQVRRRWPGTRCLLTSGYAEALVDGADLESGWLALLRKPYRMEDLARAIRAALDAG